MFRASCLALVTALVVMSGGSVGQDPKKDDKKPAELPKVDKQDTPPARVKGQLPPNWKKVGLTDDQIQQIYRIQNKHDDEIDKLQTKIDDLKSARIRDARAVLTAEQKKRLEDILLGRDK